MGVLRLEDLRVDLIGRWRAHEGGHRPTETTFAQCSEPVFTSRLRPPRLDENRPRLMRRMSDNKPRLVFLLFFYTVLRLLFS